MIEYTIVHNSGNSLLNILRFISLNAPLDVWTQLKTPKICYAYCI